MRFTIREKLLSIGQDFVITGEDGKVAYRVDGKALSWGDKLRILDGAGAEVGRIEQKVMSFVKTYRIRQGDRLLATVQKKPLALLRDRFTVAVPGGEDLAITGALLEHDYTLCRGQAVVATVSKAWLSVTDSYGVEVAEGEDPILPLAAVIVVDLVLHDREGTRATSSST